MAPLKDSFGEEWVEMDDHAEDIERNKPRQAPVVAKKGGSEHKKSEVHRQEDVLSKTASIPSSRLQNIGKSQEENSLEEESVKVSPDTMHSSTSGFKSSLDTDDMDRTKVKSMQLHTEEKSGFSSQCKQFNVDELKSEMQPLKHGLKKKPMLQLEKLEECPRQCPRWTRGSEKRPPLIRRIMSEARIMGGQVMVSKAESAQEVLSKRQYSMVKQGDNNGDTEEIKRVEGQREKSEETLVEVEVTIKKWSNMEPKAAMEGEETLVVCIPPRSSSDTHMHILSLEAVHGQIVGHEMHPESMGAKADQKDMHQRSLQAPHCSAKKLSKAMDDIHMVAHSHAYEAIEGIPSSLDGNGIQIDRAKPDAKMQSRATYKEEKPSKTFEDVHNMEAKASKIPPKAKEVVRRTMKPLEVVSKGEQWLQSKQGGSSKQATVGRFEVKEVECECCGVGEECTIGYIEHVKGLFSGHWVCGLCAEAVHEERHRLGRGTPIEEAVRTHMNMCKQFSSKKKAGELPQSPGVAHAVCHLLSRHLSDPLTSPRNAATTSPVRPLLSRTSSCLPSFSQNPPPSS